VQSMQFTEDQERLRGYLREFITRECPTAEVNRWEREGEYPHALFRRMGELGWLGLPFPERLGGADGSAVDLCILGEEVARAGFDIAAGLGVNLFSALNVAHNGTEEQASRYVPAVIRNDLRFCIAITEPEAGSDAASIRTRAVEDDDGFRISGQKIFTTAAHVPDTTLLVACRSNAAAERHEGITVLLVPNDTPGVTIAPMPALGRNMVRINTVFFDDARVPRENVLGAVDDGWRVLRAGLELERLFVSAGYAGAAQTVVDEALEYARTREQFGQPIGAFQAVAHMLADMQTAVDAGRLLVYRAAFMHAAGAECELAVSQAKLFGSETFVRVARDALQVFGGHGYVEDSSVQRHLRDALSVTITAGTSQIQRTIIARKLGLGRRRPATPNGNGPAVGAGRA
jgi:alkylation response protein AidB-like acyl-CoA dehydrogenase